MDWPLSLAEKQSRAFHLYQREAFEEGFRAFFAQVVAVEASLQAAEEELRKLQAPQKQSKLSEETPSKSFSLQSHKNQTPTSPTIIYTKRS